MCAHVLSVRQIFCLAKFYAHFTAAQGRRERINELQAAHRHRGGNTPGSLTHRRGEYACRFRVVLSHVRGAGGQASRGEGRSDGTRRPCRVWSRPARRGRACGYGVRKLPALRQGALPAWWQPAALPAANAAKPPVVCLLTLLPRPTGCPGLCVSRACGRFRGANAAPVENSRQVVHVRV